MGEGGERIRKEGNESQTDRQDCKTEREHERERRRGDKRNERMIVCVHDKQGRGGGGGQRERLE